MNVFDAADHITHFTGTQFAGRSHFRRKDTNAVHKVVTAGGFHADFVAFLDAAVFHPDQGDNAQIRIEPGVDDQRLQRGIRVTFRRRDISHQIFQHIFDIQTAFGAATHSIGRIQADNFFDFLCDFIRISLRQIHLVQYRANFQALLNGGIAVGDRLGFNALSSIHHQQCPFTGRQRTADFVAEIHVSRSINKVQLVNLTIAGFIVQRHALGFDGNTTLTLNIHRIQYLRLHFPVGKAATYLNKTI